jgi:hypothetical protein
MTHQTAIALIIVALAAGYAAWRIRQLMKKKDQTCCECEGCTLKKQCYDKKTCEIFGQSK